MSVRYLKNDMMQLVVDGERSILAERGLDGFEPIKVDFLKRHVSPGDCFIDVGACEGFYTVLVSGLVGSSSLSRVFSVEPNMDNWKTLRSNIELNECGNVLPFQMALSNQSGYGTLHLGKQTGLHSLEEGLKDRDQGTQEVVLEKVDVIRKASIDSCINGMKIDVEGHELEVLLGAHKTLSSSYFRYLAVDVHPSLGTDVNSIESLIRQYGFEITTVQGQGNEILAVKNV